MSNFLTAATLGRRQFVRGMAAGSATAILASPSQAAADATGFSAQPELSGKLFNLSIGYQSVNFTGRERQATTINGSLPAPLLRWREGDTVTLNVTNHLAVDSSIHWHGILLPSNMDGVPGLSFGGIRPGETFQYQFRVGQSGTYWYHSHSGYQEQTGSYGAIIIDPAEPDPVAYDREHVVVLSDWSDQSPHDIYQTLKQQSHYYNRRERTLGDWWRDVRREGFLNTWDERLMWNQMRMSDRDIADVTGYTYTYLMNGQPPAAQWRGQFAKGERVRLRVINASAMTLFDFRIPGLSMTVVAADGQPVEPVTVDEFRIGVAETYDVIVAPEDDSAYTLFAQSIDRSGFVCGTLAPDPSLNALIPAMDSAPILGHRDMGMSHDSMSHDSGAAMPSEEGSMKGGHHGHHGHHGHDMAQGMTMMESSPSPAKAGHGSSAAIVHPASEQGVGIDMQAMQPSSGLDDPGIGLRHHQHQLGRRVLTYGDLKHLTGTPDPRDPSRELQIHLTGNMHRYMWSMDGISYAHADPILMKRGERLRIVLVNDTMMTHPIHLHGLWSDLETGDPAFIPRKHTVMVQPGSTISYLVSADTVGRWAYHCHLLYHMGGMFREVRVL